MPLIVTSGISGKYPYMKGDVETIIPEFTAEGEMTKLEKMNWGRIGLLDPVIRKVEKEYSNIKEDIFGKVGKEDKKKVPEITKPGEEKKEGGSRFYRNADIGSLMDAYAFRKLAEDTEQTGYHIYLTSLKDLNDRFPCSYTISGWEEGDEIYIANDIPVKDMLKALAHEVAAKDKLQEYPWKTHEELHQEIFAEEGQLINSYRSRFFKSQRN